jgi:hypothetical protein
MAKNVNDNIIFFSLFIRSNSSCERTEKPDFNVFLALKNRIEIEMK